MDFAQRCGLHDAGRDQALARFAEQLSELELSMVRFA
jgi:hypothetical protein